jgi:hypothetical protein
MPPEIAPPAPAEPPSASLDFPAGATPEVFTTLPAEMISAANLRSASTHVCLQVERTANLAIEGMALVPLAEDIPPPPPEPWEVPDGEGALTPLGSRLKSPGRGDGP